MKALVYTAPNEMQLLDRPMQKRFSLDPLFQATQLLLQERVPRASALYVHAAEVSAVESLLPSPSAS